MTGPTVIVQVYHDRMGVGSVERDLRQARAALLGAVRRLERAMGRFEDSDIPLWPDRSGEFAQWTAEQKAVVTAAATVWVDFVRRREEYDAAVRTSAQPSTWPHA